MSKIPPHAERVFQGVVFDVYQWEQEMFDGSKATFECLKRPDTLVVIPMVGDKVYYALQEQPGKKPFLSLFGGRADEGETPLEAGKRELLEESGLVSDDWQELRRYSLHSKIDWTVYFFVARDCRKVAEQSLDAGEKIEVLETDLDTFLKEIITHPEFCEYELKGEIYSALNPEAMVELKAKILGK